MQKVTSTQKVDVKLGCQDKGKDGFRTIFLQFESASRCFQPGEVPSRDLLLRDCDIFVKVRWELYLSQSHNNTEGDF